jgi:hypothetical protein
MSYGLFTISRSELRDPARLREKLETATGERSTAARLVSELATAAAADPAAVTWHIHPDTAAGGRGGWRVEPVPGP